MRSCHLTAILLLLMGGVSGWGATKMVGARGGPLRPALDPISGQTVERTLAADLHTTWTATVGTLTRMKIRIRETDWIEDAWVLDGIGEQVALHARVARATPQMTKVALRVEAGEPLAEKQTAEEILNQVALSLVRQTVVTGGESLAEAVTALQGEIRHLRSLIEEKPKEAQGAEAGTVRAAGPPRPDDHVPDLAEATPQSDSGGREEVIAAPLVPVEVLTPVWSVDGRQRVH